MAQSDIGQSQTGPVGRYAWPAELDLMAEIAGMRIVERWEAGTAKLGHWIDAGADHAIPAPEEAPMTA